MNRSEPIPPMRNPPDTDVDLNGSSKEVTNSMNRRTLLSASIGPASLAAIGPASLASISAAVPAAPHDPAVAWQMMTRFSGAEPEELARFTAWVLDEGPDRTLVRMDCLSAAAYRGDGDLIPYAERFLRFIDTGSAA